MSIKILEESELLLFVDKLVEELKVVGVQAVGDRFAFGTLSKAGDLRLDYDVSILPPKQFFQPPCEKLLSFDKQGKFSSVAESEPFVLFGAHPYDVEAINQMDEVFTKDQCDAHYMSRRDSAIIVMSDVQNASSNVFAGCMGTATVERGFDVRVTKVGKSYIVEFATEKGKTLLKHVSNAKDADPASLERREQVWQKNRERLKKHELRVEPKDLPGLLANSYDHPVWEKKAKDCFSCGSCVLVCPTCYCFDVRDDVNWDLKSGARCRMWDGCMLQDFALVAGGHNFRKERADRYRHRYFRKGKYIPDKIGSVACVGCGRCVTACVSKIANPVDVFNRLLEDK